MSEHQAGPTVAGRAGLAADGASGAAAHGASGATVHGASGATPLGANWPDEVAGRIESVVGTVRDKTTVPVTKVARAVVFGLLAAVGGLVALILVVIALVRLLDVYLPFGPYGRRVWVVYAGFGAIFLLAGAFCWSRRKARRTP